ncbi:MAG TPA: cyclic nucleotide-binding domain-containing protein, partial [Marmoricola sp.]|nr:cyclic nucleotide-binding domain-containing protein [Marmoricola sp.]
MSAVRAVLSSRSLRRLVLASAVCAAAELGAFVALSVYSYRVGGATLLGTLGAARMIAGAVLVPLVTSLADRVRREHLLVATVAPRMLLMAASAALLWFDSPAWVVVVLVALGSGLHGVFRPLQAAMLPWLARDPEELTAANGVIGIAEGSAVLAGPAIAAGLLAVADVATVVAVAAALLVLGLVLMLGVHALAGTIPHEQARRHPVREWLQGLGALVADRGSRAVAGPTLSQVFARGVLNVLTVPVAVDLFDLGESGVGWLGAAMGLGGLLGGPVSLTFVRGRRLGWLTGLAVACWGLPLVALGLVHAPFAAYALFAAIGVANVVEDMSAFTALQRIAPPRLLGRALGAFEFLIMAASALGSAVAPVLLALLGPRPTLVLTGLLLVLVSAVAMPWLVGLGRRLGVPADDVRLLRALPFLDPLPVGTIEHLAAHLGEEAYDEGTTVLRQGETGDHFFVIATGSATATVDGRPVRRMAPGDFFGEIALLRDVPRTASVLAEESLQVRTLARA